LPGEQGRQAIIAAQAPLFETCENWWKMITEKNVKLILMLCQEEEKGKN